jgi:hypothetical protein
MFLHGPCNLISVLSCVLVFPINFSKLALSVIDVLLMNVVYSVLLISVCSVKHMVLV